jgi:hypothetical protein
LDDQPKFFLVKLGQSISHCLEQRFEFSGIGPKKTDDRAIVKTPKLLQTLYGWSGSSRFQARHGFRLNAQAFGDLGLGEQGFFSITGERMAN